MLLTVISRRVGGGASQPYLTFTYDGNSQRVKKYNHFTGAITLYFGEVYEVRNEEPIIHLFANTRRIASIHGDGRMQYYHGNHLHSASVITDGYGNTKETIEYHPYGTYRLRTDLDASFPNVNYTFTDQEDDDEAGLYNYKARLYDPLLGRFISADSIVPEPGNLQAYNRYSYCLNNPVVYTDPSGHWFGIDDAIIGIGMLIGAVIAGAQSDWNLSAMATGTVIGGISAGIGAGVGGAVSSAINGSITNITVAGAISGAAGGTAAGAVAGGMSAAFYGGDIGTATLTGAGFGALGGAAFGSIGYPKTLWQVGAYAAVGGGLSAFGGSDFGSGAMIAGGLALIAYGYYQYTNIGNGGRIPEGRLSNGQALLKSDDPTEALNQMDANRGHSHFGRFNVKGTHTLDSNLKWHESWSKFTYLTSHVPYANDIAYFHDFLMLNMFRNASNLITNFGSMLPAAATTFGGAAVNYSPITSGVISGMDHE